MRYAAMIVAAVLGISVPPASAADEATLSCAELAERRAERQYAEEEDARADRQSGPEWNGALQRDILRLQAESYRKKVLRDCLRLRPGPDDGQAPAPPGG